MKLLLIFLSAFFLSGPTMLSLYLTEDNKEDKAPMMAALSWVSLLLGIALFTILILFYSD